MPKMPSLEEMLKAGVHFGHQVSKWHPKMEPYIFLSRNNIHLFNLELTAKKLQEALDYTRKLAAEKKTIIFISTKKQAKAIVKKYAEEAGVPFVINRWLGGTLTNFSTIKKVLDKLNNLRAQDASGELKKYTKKEQLKFKKEIERLDEAVGGIASLNRIPDAIFILDAKKEKTALREAQRKRVPVIAVCDTNTDPTGIDYVIPANDDAVKSIDMLVGLMAEAIKEGKAEIKTETVIVKK